MAIATKNVEEKDSKTVALISLLVTVFLYCCNCRSKYTSHTKKWCCLSNMCTSQNIFNHQLHITYEEYY